VVDGDEDFEGPDNDGGADGEQRDEAIQMVGIASSIASWSGGMASLE
jgi:hypothetical protein